MEKLLIWLETNIMPTAQKIGSQKHLVAIRDGFVALMPLVIAGSLAVLLNSILFKDAAAGGLIAGWLDISKESNMIWRFFAHFIPVMGNIWWGTFAFMALILTFTIGYSLANQNDVNPLATGVVTIGGYIALTPQGVEGTWGNLGWQYTNFGALLAAVILALFIAQIFIWLMRSGLTIKLPDGVPPAVGKAFAAIIPGFVAILVASVIPLIISQFSDKNIFLLLTDTVINPLLSAGQSLIFALVYVFLIGLFWFFGLHGGNMFGPVTNGVYLPALGNNQAIIEKTATAGTELQVFTPAFFDSFVHLGGAGAIIGLLIAIFWASKREDYKAVSKVSLPASTFQISEPAMYGLPIVLNPLLFIPFLLIPLVLTTVAYFATLAGIAGYTYVAIPWTTPPVLGAFLSTGGSFGAALTALVNLILAVILYYPFVMMANKHEDI